MQNKLTFLQIFRVQPANYSKIRQQSIASLQNYYTSSQLKIASLPYSIAAKISYSYPLQNSFAALQKAMVKLPFYLYGSQLLGCMYIKQWSSNQPFCNPAIWFCIAAKCSGSIQNSITCLTLIIVKPTCKVVKLQNKNVALQNKIVPLHCHSPPAYK